MTEISLRSLMEQLEAAGDEINLFDLPVPLFLYQDGGRHIDTIACTITKDPDSGILNVAIAVGRSWIGQE